MLVHARHHCLYVGPGWDVVQLLLLRVEANPKALRHHTDRPQFLVQTLLACKSAARPTNHKHWAFDVVPLKVQRSRVCTAVHLVLKMKRVADRLHCEA